MTVEFFESANKPLAIPELGTGCRLEHAALFRLHSSIVPCGRAMPVRLRAARAEEWSFRSICRFGPGDQEASGKLLPIEAIPTNGRATSGLFGGRNDSIAPVPAHACVFANLSA